MKEVQGYQAKQLGDIMLNANELYHNVSEDILSEIQEAIPTILFNRYPDPESKELLQAYAKVANLQENQLLAGNGSDEMLGLLIGYFLGNNKVLYTLQPDFSMYDYYAGMHEAVMVKFPCQLDGSFDVGAFITKGKQANADMILFSNPNNPTGHMVSKEDLIAILAAFDDIPVIIDEAYGEFAKVSMLSEIEHYTNLYVTRTLSKAYGLAGARLGFLISSAQNIAQLKPNMVPYNVNSISQKVGVIVLSHAAKFQREVQATIEARDQLYEKIKNFASLQVMPSQANYLFVRTAYKQKLLQYMEQEGIILRNYEADDSLRITIGSDTENSRVLAVLQKLEESICVK